MNHQTDNQIVWGLIRKLRVCMLVTHSQMAGELRARPMTALLSDDEEAIYFLTDVRKQKDNEIGLDQNICLTFSDTGSHQYVSVSGIATVSDDRDKIGELWSAAAQLWWDSKDDPNIRVLHITPLRAEYWDSPGSIVTTVKMVAAALTGTRANLGESKKVEL
jgi:general stress protein 26